MVVADLAYVYGGYVGGGWSNELGELHITQ